MVHRSAHRRRARARLDQHRRARGLRAPRGRDHAGAGTPRAAGAARQREPSRHASRCARGTACPGLLPVPLAGERLVPRLLHHARGFGRATASAHAAPSPERRELRAAAARPPGLRAAPCRRARDRGRAAALRHRRAARRGRPSRPARHVRRVGAGRAARRVRDAPAAVDGGAPVTSPARGRAAPDGRRFPRGEDGRVRHPAGTE